MNITDAKIDLEVVRSKGDYVVGRIGKIVAIDQHANRVQVAWHHLPKTWVKVDAVEPTSTPYLILPAEIYTTGKRKSYPKYKVI